MENIEVDQKKEEYINPFDWSDIFYEEGEEEDPLYEWVKEVGDPMIDEPGGRPNSHIVSQMGVNVDKFVADIQVQQGSQLGGVGGDDDDSAKFNLDEGDAVGGDDGGDDGGGVGGQYADEYVGVTSQRPHSVTSRIMLEG